MRNVKRPHAPLRVVTVCLCLASCSDSTDDSGRTRSGAPDVFTVTVTEIEMQNADTGQVLQVTGETVSGSVVISPTCDRRSIGDCDSD